MDERDWDEEATQLVCGDKLAAHDRLVALLKAEAAIAVIQQNAADNYAASENRLHACEEQRNRLLAQLAGDDDEKYEEARSRAAKSVS